MRKSVHTVHYEDKQEVFGIKSKDNVIISLQIENTNLPILIDNGASCNIIDFEAYYQIKPTENGLAKSKA